MAWRYFVGLTYPLSRKLLANLQKGTRANKHAYTSTQVIIRSLLSFTFQKKEGDGGTKIK